MAAASQAKAQVYVAAINKAFATEFATLGMSAGVGNTVQTKTIKTRDGNVPNIMATYGTVTIPGVPMNQIPIKWVENGVMGEGGNGGKWNGPPGQSPGAQGSSMSC